MFVESMATLARGYNSSCASATVVNTYVEVRDVELQFRLYLELLSQVAKTGVLGGYSCPSLVAHMIVTPKSGISDAPRSQLLQPVLRVGCARAHGKV